MQEARPGVLVSHHHHPSWPLAGNIWELDRMLTVDEVVEGHRPLMARDEYRYGAKEELDALALTLLVITETLSLRVLHYGTWKKCGDTQDKG